MAVLTSRLKLRKPDPTDVVNVITDIEQVYDTIDAAIGYAVVTSGTRPGTPYVGQTIFETDTGRTYFWNGTAWIKFATENADLVNTSAAYGGVGVKNALINSVGFPINQRGAVTYSSAGGVQYTCDHLKYVPSAGETGSIQWITAGPGQYPGIACKQQINWNRSVAGSSYSSWQEPIEDVRTLAGQTVTLSVLCAAASGTVDLWTQLTQFFGTGGSPSATNYNPGATKTVGTTPTVLSWTFNLTSLAGKTLGSNNDHCLNVELNRPQVGNGILTTLAIFAMQLELGPVFTGFEQRPIQTELAMCQRYYQRKQAIAAAEVFGIGFWQSTTVVSSVVPFYPMRATPSIAISPGASNWANQDPVVGGQACSAIAVSIISNNSIVISSTASAAIGTAGRGGFFIAGTPGNCYIEFIAEL